MHSSWFAPKRCPKWMETRSDFGSCLKPFKSSVFKSDGASPLIWRFSYLFDPRWCAPVLKQHWLCLNARRRLDFVRCRPYICTTSIPRSIATERWLCTVRYGYSSLFFSFCLTSITLTHGEGIVCVNMAMDTLHGTLGTRPIPSLEGLFNLYLNVSLPAQTTHTPWFRKQLRTFPANLSKW